MSIPPVIIAGAGPSGLSTALFLTERNVPVIVIDQHEEPYADPRAATFHPPTLEMLAPSGITERLHQRGLIVPTWQMWDRKNGLVAEFDLSTLRDVTCFPYRLQCEQHKLVQMLRDILSKREICTFLNGERIENVVQEPGMVRVETSKGSHIARYLVGADGGRSVVRKSQGIGFEGFSYPERFLVITNTYDFEAEGYALSCYVSDPEEWCALFKVPGDGPPGLWRTVFPTAPEEAEEVLVSYEYAQDRLERFLPKPKPYEIVHTNLYSVQQRVAAQYRKGNVLLVGDAAHVNNPLGGMGMNFGIHDACNLAEKLALVINNGAGEEALDLYARQRRSVAKDFLQSQTIENKKALEEKDETALRQRQNFLREASRDPVKSAKYLHRTAMFEGLEAAAAIT
jgi:3-(3-hydroxy-phenyl)propionate hydroxylase